MNADLHAALHVRAAELSSFLTLAASGLVDLDVEASDVRLTLGDGGTARAGLVVGADGRGSLVRERAGIALADWSYPQSALVFNIAHRLPHGQTSTEFHTRNGPFTQVPLPGLMSSIVWVDAPESSALLADLGSDRLAERAEARMHSILGPVEIASPVQSFPLKGANARRMTATRIALVGEAAHVFPPIGAQGLNLGLRDAAAIVAAAAAHRDDPGSPAALVAYETARRADVATRSAGVDLLNRSLLDGFLPIQAARSIGLGALAGLPFLRRFVIREGVSPGAGLWGIPSAVSTELGGIR